VGTVAIALTIPLSAGAQPQPPGSPQRPPATLTFQAAIQYAVDHYPTVRAALEQVNASTAGVSVARSAYLPRLDALWQSNRATANNIFGQLFPQSVIPAMSGPVLASASADSVWGSAAGALFSWEPFDFGLRQAGVDAAEAAVGRARAGEAITRLDVQRAVGGAFLGVVAAQRTVAALQADLDRRDVLVRAVHTLADNQLRPGADASRVDAERAAALTRLIQARQTLTLAQTTLARLLGVRPAAVAIDASGLLDVLPPPESAPPAAQEHPLAQARQASVDAAHAQERILSRTDLPRVYLQSSVFARGSGADPSGMFDGGVGGLGLERANWAAGVQIQIPNLFDFASLRARKTAAAANARAESALYDEALLSIASEQDAAAAMLDASRAVAENTPVQLAAARQTEAQARARYEAGLAAIVEVADAQSLLAQAEMQDALARVDVWRALLADAVARGSVVPLLSRIPTAPGAR
jgi:outer membrane protein